MRDDAFIKKGRDPALSEIDELIRQQHIPGVDRLLHAADRADGNHLRTPTALMRIGLHGN